MKAEVEQVIDAPEPGTLVYLDPNDIMEPESTNVRPWSTKHGDTEAEIKAIEELAKSIGLEGQLQPGKVVRLKDVAEGEPQWALIMGRRRRRAIIMHNLSLDENKEPLKFAAVVADEDIKAPRMFRQAAHENLHRAGVNPMDFAGDIAYTRSKFKWKKDSDGTQKVADFFGVSYAQITEHEKLLTLPEDVQVRVHNGDLSKDQAFQIARIQEKAGPGVASATAELAVAAGNQVVEQAMQESVVSEGDDTAVDPTMPTPTTTTTGKKKAAKKAAKPAVKKAAAAAKSKVIQDKLREVDPNKAQPRSKSQLIEYFNATKGPAYGHANGAVWRFAEAFEQYAKGIIQDRTLDKYFDKMVENADKGTPTPVEAAAAKPTKPATPAKPAAKRKK